MPRKSPQYHVAPRYTPGSPALVDEPTALQVAAEECSSYEYHLQGRHGELEQLRAQQLGLANIVEKRIEVRDGWAVEDLITQETFTKKVPRK
jgi:hypothetical protein